MTTGSLRRGLLVSLFFVASLFFFAVGNPKTHAQVAPLLYTTLDDIQSVSSPAAGTGIGASASTSPVNDFVLGNNGNAIRVDAAREFVRFQQTDGTIHNVELSQGTVDFWFKPSYPHNDGLSHRIFGIGTRGQPGSIGLYKQTSQFGNGLYFAVVTSTGTEMRAVAKPTWAANQWVHMRFTWNSGAAAGQQNARMYINDTEVFYTSFTSGPFSMPAESASQYIWIGAMGSTETENATGVIDDFTIYNGALAPGAGPDITAPSVPQNFITTAVSASQINLSWSASTDNIAVAGYRVYRGGVQIATTTQTSFSNTGLQPATSYSYAVAAYDGAGNSSAQSAVSVATTLQSPDVTAPSIPQNVVANPISSNQITITWSPSTDPVVANEVTSGLVGYKIYRGGVQVGTSTQTSFTNSGLNSGTLYSYTVSAYDAAGNVSAQSASSGATTFLGADTAAPSVPTGVAAVCNSPFSVDITWNASVDPTVAGQVLSGLEGYKIYRGGVHIATTTTTSFTDTSVSPSTAYSYTIVSFDHAGNASSQSAASNVTTQNVPDTENPVVDITSPTASSTVSDFVTITANASDNVGVAGVQFYRGFFPLGVEDTTAPYQVVWDTNSFPNGFYELTAVARDLAGNTTTSVTVPVILSNDVTPPTVPTSLSAIPISTSRIDISWSPSTDNVSVTGYFIYRDGNFIATSSIVSFSDTGLTALTSYTYEVAAFDVRGNVSPLSAPASAQTLNDTIAPTVSLTAPLNGTTVSGVQTLTATASDNIAVAGVKFYAGSTQVGNEDTSVPYSVTWDTNSLTNGAFVLVAVARDTSGNVATSSLVNVTVQNSVLPVPSVAYSFDEGTGTTAADSSGHNVTATLTNNPSWAPGVYNGGIFFNGTSNYVTLPTNNSLRPANAVTVTVWANSSAWTQAGERPLVSGSDGLSGGYYIASNIYGSNKLEFAAKVGCGSGAAFVKAGMVRSTVPSGWHHFTGVFNGSSVSFYMDGILKESVPVSGSCTIQYLYTMPVRIGGDPNIPRVNPYFNGTLDNVRIYNQALTPAQIQADMNAPINPIVGTDTTPPTVSIVTPQASTTLSSVSTIRVSAGDNVYVSSVRLKVDGVFVGNPIALPPYNFSLDTTQFADGLHTITVVATDSSGNTASASVQSTFNNTNRPNIVLILSDDQRWDTMQYMPLTTSLLNAETVKFNNAFTAVPDCCPSRASILTGLYAHNHGVLQDYNQNGGAPAFNPNSTIATWLKDAGYRTGTYGKYMNSYYSISPQVPPGWDDFNVFVKNWVAGGDGDFFYNYDLNENGIVKRYNSTAADYSTTVLGNKAVNFINSTPANQPLYMHFTPYAPHDPVIPDPADIGSFASTTPWRPASFGEPDVSDKPAWVRAMPAFNSTDISTIDTFRIKQFETLQSLDRQVAAIIQALQQTGRWNNTLLVFSSDNGMLWGEHRVINSKFSVYEESIKVPLWVRAPGLTSRTDNSIMGTIDFAPSFADWAGVPPATAVNGLSFKNLLANASAPWRSEILVEYLGPTINTNLRFQAVRDSRYVYNELLSGDRELYDLQTDPLQLTNLYNNPSYASVQAMLQAKLAALKLQ